MAAATVRNKAGLYHALVVVFGVAARLVKTDTTIANSLLVQMGHRVVKFTGLLPSDCQHAPEYHLNNVQTEHETGMQGVGASPNRA